MPPTHNRDARKGMWVRIPPGRSTMKLCKTPECTNNIPKSIIIDGFKRPITNRTRCLKCVPYGTSRYTTPTDKLSSRTKNREKSRRHYYKTVSKEGKNPISLRWENRKKFILSHIDNKCQICGYNKLHKNIVFHHVDPKTKKFSISTREFQFSFQNIKDELLKCIAVCHLCHGEIHEGLIDKAEIHMVYQRFKSAILRLEGWPEKVRDNTVRVEHKCAKCKVKLWSKGKSGLCRKCHNINKCKIKWPPTSQLLNKLKSVSYTKLANELGISARAIRKRLKNHPI